MPAKYKTKMKKVHEVYKLGNLKIGYDTAILNFGTAKDCPSRKLGFCKFENNVNAKRKGKDVCYACKMEWSTKVIEYREKQERYWLTTPTETIIDDLKNIMAKNAGVRYFRINESHDLKTIDDVYRLHRIAIETGLKVYTYTHRYDIIEQLIKDNYVFPKNLVINVSDKEYDGFNSFIAVDVDKFEELKASGYKNLCKMDCTTCGLCKVNHGKTTYVPKH